MQTIFATWVSMIFHLTVYCVVHHLILSYLIILFLSKLNEILYWGGKKKKTLPLRYCTVCCVNVRKPILDRHWHCSQESYNAWTSKETRGPCRHEYVPHLSYIGHKESNGTGPVVHAWNSSVIEDRLCPYSSCLFQLQNHATLPTMTEQR